MSRPRIYTHEQRIEKRKESHRKWVDANPDKLIAYNLKHNEAKRQFARVPIKPTPEILQFMSEGMLLEVSDLTATSIWQDLIKLAEVRNRKAK